MSVGWGGWVGVLSSLARFVALFIVFSCVTFYIDLGVAVIHALSFVLSDFHNFASASFAAVAPSAFRFMGVGESPQDLWSYDFLFISCARLGVLFLVLVSFLPY